MGAATPTTYDPKLYDNSRTTDGKLDPSKAEADATLGLSKDEVVRFYAYRNQYASEYHPTTPGLTPDKWAEQNKLGVYKTPDAVANGAPDLTDEAVKKSRLDEMSRLLSSNGRKSTFLTGPLGDLTMPQLGKTFLGGG